MKIVIKFFIEFGNVVIRREVRNWLIEAEMDLKRCEWSLNISDYALSCYLAQQCIEKSFKALIIQVKHELPRTHDLTRLYRELQELIHLSPYELSELSNISQYYVTTHYPNAGIEIPSQSFTEVQARRAYELASKVFRIIKEIIGKYDC